VAEAILTGEEVKEFAPEDAAAPDTLALAIQARLAEYFFVSNRPGHAGSWNREYEEPRDLNFELHRPWLDAITAQIDRTA